MLARGGSVRRFDLSRGRVASDPERDVVRVAADVLDLRPRVVAPRARVIAVVAAHLPLSHRGTRRARREWRMAKAPRPASSLPPPGASGRPRLDFACVFRRAQSLPKKRSTFFDLAATAPAGPTDRNRPRPRTLNKISPFRVPARPKKSRMESQNRKFVRFFRPSLASPYMQSLFVFSRNIVTRFFADIPGLKTHPRSDEVDFQSLSSRATWCN